MLIVKPSGEENLNQVRDILVAHHAVYGFDVAGEDQKFDFARNWGYHDGKAKERSPSSLELFLDTICNTFGGIVFLAILLSVIVQNRTKDPVQTQNDRSFTPDEARILALRSEQLSDRLNQLNQLLAELQPFQTTNDDRAIDEVADQLASLQKRLAAEISEQAKLASQINIQSDKNANLLKRRRNYRVRLNRQKRAWQMRKIV